ncbi:MAG: ABC transporter permease [Nanoarchaeota archaeon]|nr:ABC transporter permease [Nanoarchaeota archaeon]
MSIAKIPNEILKNFKLIFRNWSSLALIILAPLVLILLVGYSFSGEKLHDIKIGVVASDNLDLSELQRNVTGIAEIVRYETISGCLLDMALEESHICLEVTGNLSQAGASNSEIPTGEVKFYFDNTRMKTTLPLLTQIKDFFGLTSERISLVSTQTVLDNLQNFISYLSQRIDDIESAKTEAETIRLDLIDRRKQLVKVRDDFRPKYLAVKSFQTKVHKNLNSFTNSSDSLIKSLDDLETATDYLQDKIFINTSLNLLNKSISLPFNNSLNNSLNLPFNNSLNLSLLQNFSNSLSNSLENALDFNFSSLAPTPFKSQVTNISVSEIKSQIISVRGKVNATSEDIKNITVSLDDAIAQLDAIDALLEGEIARTDRYIVKIDQSVKRIDAIVKESRSKINEISKFDSSLAQKLIKPITQSFQQLKSGVKNIQLAFPILLTTVIVFISLLFANIIALLEIYNKAYTRNILAPVDDVIYTIGIALTNFIVVSFQIFVLLLVAQFSFKIAIASHIWSMLPVLILLVFIFVFLGMIIAYISNNIQTSILITTFGALVFFLLSDILNALESMPKPAAIVAMYNPVVIANSMFRKILFFDIPLKYMTFELGLLFLYAVITFILLVLISKKKNKQRI